MSKFPKIVAIIMIVAGAIMIVAGAVTYYQVQQELSDEKIVVSDDAENFAGEDVTGPLTVGGAWWPDVSGTPLRFCRPISEWRWNWRTLRD